MDIGTLIQVLREKKGLSQDQLAQKMKISQAHVSVLERGTSPVTAEHKKQLGKAFGLPLEMVELYRLKRDDVPASKRLLFDILHPLMQQMIDQFIV